MAEREARASWRRARTVKPTHSCDRCEGRRPQPAVYGNQCPVVRIYTQADEALMADLKQKGLYPYRDPAWVARLRRDLRHASDLLALADNKIDPRWPVRVAVVADIVLSAREAVRVEEVAG